MKIDLRRLAASTLVASLVLCFSTNTGAIEPIPEEPGWSVFWGESDSKINFHDNELAQIAVGLIYNFGGPGASAR